jgi:MFS family permease
MSKWLLRGLVFAALMVIVRLLQGAMINAWETKAGLVSIVLVVLFAVAVFAWGLIDGRADARANPDPDRRGDLAMTWLLAGLFAGVLSGIVAWFISLFYDNLYVEALLNEVTTFAAFTALLTFLAAVAGVALGRWLVDRKAPEGPAVRHHGLAAPDQDRADTDVFAAVGGGRTQAEATEGQRTESVATPPEPSPTEPTTTETPPTERRRTQTEGGEAR